MIGVDGCRILPRNISTSLKRRVEYGAILSFGFLFSFSSFFFNPNVGIQGRFGTSIIVSTTGPTNAKTSFLSLVEGSGEAERLV